MIMSNKNFHNDLDWDNASIAKLKQTILPEPDVLTYYNQIAKREIFINGDIDEYCADHAKLIFDWNFEDRDIPKEQRKKIKIFLHTDGGCVASMNVLIAAIMLSKTPITTIAMGKIFSAGAMIFLSADERLLLSTSRVMIHKGSSGIISDVNKIIDYSKFLEKDNELSKKFILERTNITAKKYKEVEDKDWYLLPQECVDLGIATKIVENIDELF